MAKRYRCKKGRRTSGTKTKAGIYPCRKRRYAKRKKSTKKRARNADGTFK